MRRHHSLRLRILVLAAVLAAPLAARAQLRCEMIPQLMAQFLRNHVSQTHLTPELEKRTIDTFVLGLDSSRSLLLTSEVDKAHAEMAGIFGRVEKGDCGQLSQVHQFVSQYYAKAEKFVRAFVDDPAYHVDQNVELVIDPDERGSPASAEQRNDLLRKLVHFQMSNYLEVGESMDEAKHHLVHRYELRTRRMAEMNQQDLYARFLDSFAASLDPHSNYLSADVLEDFRISMSLSLEGIGVALSERDGYSVVERIIPGGAAARLEKGLQPKDKIIAVAEDGGQPVSIIDMPLRDAVSLIRGKKGTKVQLTVLRQGDKTERFPITIVRDKIDLKEQAAKIRYATREVDGKQYKLAIIDLPSFYGGSDPSQRQCTDDVERLLEEAKAQKVDGLLLDLSRNGGGLLEHAVKISGFFIRRGEIVGVENGRGQLQVLPDRDERILYSGPLVVHTSRISASASEILAGALKDYKRAVITGDDHTFGKGTVQTVTTLPPGQGALKITTALFFRPGGKSTQNDGVESEVTIPSVLGAQDFGERTQRYALPSQSLAPFLSSYANAIGPEDRWSHVDDAVLAELARRSEARVKANPEFAEIEARIKETRENDGRVRLSEMLKEREEARAHEQSEGKDDDGSSAGGDSAQDIHTPQLEEAINVLADLVSLERKGI